MKKLSYIIVMLFLITVKSNAQIVKVDNHYGPPVWAPKAPATVKYYYLPDIQTYYDVPAQRYIYNNNGTWVRTASLPTYYKGYNLRSGRTVYLTDYRGNTPYILYNQHIVKYKGNGKWKRNDHDNGLHKGQNKQHYEDNDDHGKGHGKGHHGKK